MNLDKSTKTRTERPDKAGFPAMLAILLLLGGIGFGVMDYGSYQSYRRAVNYVEEIRRHPETLADVNYKPEFIIAINEADAARYRLQMFWVSAVMLLFLSVGSFLLNRSVKTYRRIRNLEYEEIDWRSLEKPAQRIEVLYGRTHTVAAIIFYVFFGGLILLVFLNGINSRTIIVGSLNILLVLTVYYLLTRGKSKSIKSYDASGITRVDGLHFLWSDFRGVIPRIGNYRYGGKANWRTELVFTDRRVVWVIPQRIKNYAEVYGFVNALPQAVLKNAAQISQSKIVAE